MREKAQSLQEEKNGFNFFKKFKNKKDAMKYEYFLKNNRKLRLNIKQDFLNTI